MPINNIIKGDLVKLAKEGRFDVITHGCNCWCAMKRGIAPQLAAAFGADQMPLEQSVHKGNINKLGQIDTKLIKQPKGNFWMVNSYTQNMWSTPTDPLKIDYDALALVFTKLNSVFKGMHVGIPKIGAGLAGGDWAFISGIIDEKTPDLNITLVEYEAN